MATQKPKWFFFKFYPAEYLQDTAILSLEAQGAWMRLLCAMWIAPQRGKLDWSLSQFETYLGLHRVDAVEVWNELLDSGIGDLQYHDTHDVTQSPVRVTLICRRMYREEVKRNQTLNRVRRHRSRKSNAFVTRDILEVRSYKLEDTERNPPLTGDVTPVPPESFTVKDLVESWNEVFAGRLPTVQWPLSKGRYAKAAARVREHPDVEFWQKVFDNIGRSAFLLGSKNGAGHEFWKCTLDFLIANDSNSLKIYEGGYNAKT